MNEGYYCISCKRIHETIHIYQDHIFTTGFYTLQNGERIHLGMCNTKNIDSSDTDDHQKQIEQNSY